jgi:hypothetical protein
MLIAVFSFLVVILLGIYVFIKGRDDAARSGAARWLMIAGLVLLGLQAGFYLVFAVGEMLGGDLSGAGHLVQMLPALLLMWLVWRRPLEGGLVLLFFGVIPVLAYGTNALPITGPAPLAGLLFLVGAILSHRRPLQAGH